MNNPGEAGQRDTGARAIAIVGPFQSGKTTLLEALLARTGAIGRQGTVAEGNTLGDGAPEARAHQMTVEANFATTQFMDDDYTFIDSPGSVEFQSERDAILTAVDAAIVVCEPDEKKVPALQVILHDLEARNIPHFLFINKIDKASTRLRDMLEMLQPASELPLVLRQIPIWEKGVATGFIDLALERAYVYREHAPSEIVSIPGDHQDREAEARYTMLEHLADYDDALMEQLLDDLEPPLDRVFDDLATDVMEGVICPVLIGAAERGNGVGRLLKALRHEVRGVQTCCERLGLSIDETATAQVMKSIHTSHGGKLSVARVLSGTISEGDALVGANGEAARVSATFRLMGQDAQKRGPAQAGEIVALGKLEPIGTGETVAIQKDAPEQLAALRFAPTVFSRAVAARDRKDEVKLGLAFAKIIDEDPSLVLDHAQDIGQMVVRGQGEMHLRVALERLTGKYGIAVDVSEARVAYRETIRKSTTQRARHKKQSGGHGQFGDVVVDINPLPRGSGFLFDDTISGGVVPKQYIPAVRNGIEDALLRGPLGFPVVDIGVTLTDGSHHAVDSSEQAFKMAGRAAMVEGLPDCSPVLLEPIMKVSVIVPSEATAKVNAIVSARRGHILGFDAREDWTGWDKVEAQIPAAEMSTLIVELRSVSAGVGTFEANFDHLSELTGRAAAAIVEGALDKSAA